MAAFFKFWKEFRLLPSAWLLILQLFTLILSSLTSHSHLSVRAISWVLGILALLIIAKVIKNSPVITAVGLIFVIGALGGSGLILMGFRSLHLQIITHVFEILAYLYGAVALLRYMFADRYLTKDELFAAGAVFTLLAWAFAFAYNICQLIDPTSFTKDSVIGARSWLDLIFLSFSLQSATGLSDIIPTGSAARVLAILQMFVGVMYLAVVVTRLIALQYIQHASQQK